MKLSLQHDLDKLEKRLKEHEIALTKNAIPQAVNRTIVSVQRLALKEIAGTTGMSQKAIKEKFRLVKTAPKRKMEAIIDAKGAKGSNLIKFIRAAVANTQHFRSRTTKGRYKHPGVKAKAWQQTKYYKGTFIGKTKGNLRVFKRNESGKLENVAGPSPGLSS